MQTLTRSNDNPAPEKQQRPMGFSEFNHCIDILLGHGIANGPDSVQIIPAAKTTPSAPRTTPSTTSACHSWNSPDHFAGSQAA
ncbi:hypothetical protein [Photobacterium sp. TY1-4]|uniref:hypothetical protein n=1 Tax=Photobacterium sp. TY1-4 TaxID=2899122 RepID=UPI0021BF9B80|nr:hypothetical protein [Photobacterium sp. TY1-4]UXI03320.1 hypothetical protein NH461_23125 [Photobacterium sp. TY1-4]